MGKIERLHKIEKIRIAVAKICPWLIGGREVRLSDILYWALAVQTADNFWYYEVVNSLLTEEKETGDLSGVLWDLAHDDLAKQPDDCLEYLCRLT